MFKAHQRGISYLSNWSSNQVCRQHKIIPLYILPSEHEGGDVVARHHGETKKYKTATKPSY